MSRSYADVLTGARTMWELVDRRADASPRPPHAHRCRRRDRDASAQFRDRAERVAAGLQAMGVTTDRWSRGSCRPGSTPWCCPQRCPASARCRTRSSISTASGRSASHCARPAPPSSSSPAPGGTPTTRRWPSVRSKAPPRKPGHPLHRRRPARGRPRLPARPPPGTAPERTPRSAGSTTPPARRPTPRACSTPTRPSSPAGGAWPALSDMKPDDVGSIAFPFAHIAGPDYLVTMLTFGFPAILVESFSAPDVLAALPGRMAPPWSAAAPPSTSPTWPSSARTRPSPSSRRCA